MPLIPRTDLDVFGLCLGGNVFGWTADREASFAVLDAYAAAGGNFVDTADVYMAGVPGNSGGESETIIGEWMAARGNRDDVVIATKVGKLAGLDNLRADTIRRAAEDSLRRLGVDHIDLYYSHGDDPDTPLEETLGAFGELVEAGKVRHLAASNYSGERLAEALRVADRAGEYLDGRGERMLCALDAVAAAHGVALAAVAIAWLRQQDTVVAPIASARNAEQLAPLVAGAGLELTGDELTRLASI